jgi:hypothetical protein
MFQESPDFGAQGSGAMPLLVVAPVLFEQAY